MTARRTDPVLWAVPVALSLLGLVAVYSATRGQDGDESFAVRQVLFLLVAVGVALATSRLDHREVTSVPVTIVVVVATFILLVAVLTPLGTEVRGTRAWFQAFGLSFQPAELAKVSLVLVLAPVLALRRRDRRDPARIRRRFATAMVVCGLYSLLVEASGETGTVIVYVAVTLGMLLWAEVPRGMVVLLVASGLVALTLLVTTGQLEPYQQERLESFLDVDADPQGSGYNQRQSLTAIGSGGVAGQGLFGGPQTQQRYLPEQQTDFIFAVIGEELGFIGAVGVIAGQAAILFRILGLARSEDDPQGELIAIGVFAYLGFQVVQNIAMNLRVAPVVGLPLPFVSYGGSSLVTSFLAIGLVQAVVASRRASGSRARRPPPLPVPGAIG